MRRSRIAGVGRAVPEKVLSNFDLEKIVETSDAWITDRSGIKERRILADDLCTSDLAAEAGRKALAQAELEPKDIDMIIVGTVTPDMPMPATATFVQHKLGAPRCPAFDISAACAGFIYGLSIADSFVGRGACERVLVVGVEILSRSLDWTDRTTCVLFGDGAGAAVVTASDDPERGIIDTLIASDGEQACHLEIPGGGTKHPATHDTVEKKLHFVHMNGRQIFTQAVRNMSSASSEILERNGLGPDDVNTVFAHQANIRILESVSQRTRIPMERFFNNIARYGNTSSASIPIAMSEAIEQDRVAKGDLFLLTALGAGVSWGSALVRW
ncbi:MAG: ketoacyl-ACP synthase III [Myxococcales bacterium]|nr:ketoacyl-ACP synthase III [Myxococcales bacterium]